MELDPPKPHPEDFCQRCNGRNVVWWVDSDRFNLAMGGLGLTRSAIVCPSCFVEGHEKASGLGAAWEIRPSTVFRPLDAPKRIQLRRTKGWRKPEGAISVARPTRWGNPFQIDGKYLFDHTRNEFVALEGRDAREVAVEMHRDWLLNRAPYLLAAVPQLAGHDLACWCALDAPCHADVLLELANPGFLVPPKEKP